MILPRRSGLKAQFNVKKPVPIRLQPPFPLRELFVRRELPLRVVPSLKCQSADGARVGAIGVGEPRRLPVSADPVTFGARRQELGKSRKAIAA